MSGIFPNIDDGGLPPNPQDANNPRAAYPPITPPSNTAALYYGNGCDVRLRPEVINSLISEIEAIVDQASLPYNFTNRENAEHAIRYMIQRGLPRAYYAAGGPNNYYGALDPPATAHNNFMTLTMIPAMNNIGPVTIDIGLGAAYLLRNDGTNLDRDDLKAGKPLIIAFYNGYWYVAGLVSGQVPIIVKGGIDCWIRPDGNDYTGDGTANTPGKAFRTINGCWNAVGSRYAATPLFSINMRLGIPGDYEACAIFNFGGNVSLTGDPYNWQAYRILSHQDYEHVYTIWCGNMSLAVSGVNMVMVHPTTNANGNSCLRVGNGSFTWAGNMGLTMAAASPSSYFVMFEAGSFHINVQGVNVYFEGNSLNVGFGMCMNLASSSYGTSPPGPPANYHWSNINFTVAAAYITDQAVWRPGTTNFYVSNTHGPKYIVNGNAILGMNGQPWPGDTPGSVSTQGQVFP